MRGIRSDEIRVGDVRRYWASGIRLGSSHDSNEKRVPVVNAMASIFWSLRAENSGESLAAIAKNTCNH